MIKLFVFEQVMSDDTITESGHYKDLLGFSPNFEALLTAHNQAVKKAGIKASPQVQTSSLASLSLLNSMKYVEVNCHFATGKPSHAHKSFGSSKDDGRRQDTLEEESH